MKLSDMLNTMKQKLPAGGAATLNRPVIIPAAGPGPGMDTIDTKESKSTENLESLEIQPERTINAGTPISLSIKQSDMESALERLVSISGAETFTDAIEVSWFNINNKDKKAVALLSMLTTIYRCSLDGAVTPKINIEDNYRNAIKRVRDMTIQSPGMSPGPAPKI